MCVCVCVHVRVHVRALERMHSLVSFTNADTHAL